jgi:membrane protein
VKHFLRAEKPSTPEDIARELQVPIRLIRSILAALTDARILSQVCSDSGEGVAYQPACDIDRLTVAEVRNRLDQQGTDTLPIAESGELAKLRETLKRFREMNEQSPANLKLQDL